jgi:hypothetical protein
MVPSPDYLNAAVDKKIYAEGWDLKFHLSRETFAG